MLPINIPVLALTERHVAVGDTITVAGVDAPVKITGVIFPENLTMDVASLEKQARVAIPRTGDFSVVVSGFTPALLAVINAAASDATRVIYCLHWDSQQATYISQAVYTACLHG